MIAAAAVLIAACESLEWGRGELRLGFVDGDYVSTKSYHALPDTSDFILTVTDASGKQVYNGLYGASPEALSVGAGTYTVRVVSNEFTAPAFDAPQFGDEQTVKVAAGAKVSVKLVCSQINSGMRLRIDSSFLTACPDGLLFLKSSEGRLHYAYMEDRIAYFNPGTVSVILEESGKAEVLLSRTLSEQQVLTMNISATSASDASSLTLQLDTTRTWLSDDYVIGGTNPSKGTAPDSAYSTVTAKENIGATGVWVLGYIVGGDMTSSVNGIKYNGPFTSRTNLAIGPRSSVSSKSSCLSVFLPTGAVRDALNLVDHPENIGKQVFVKGDIVEAYYGIPGVKNVTEYQFK